ncbi:hypothetical protein OTK01_000420 [Caldicellulosiruptor acetigenus]|uniref:hypothetical protein n=1 Tax=Caldicellulosiruptor acetigenus TaxID=301953 RepID=UPI0022A9CA85|nr:hypothetical protein [Caldicellulosiruptor acetigenus]WAM36643.1 hypothetical protein OTK01_000420 [Caldicellulosiruptor acetigenus]
MVGTFMGFVSHDTALYRVERLEDGCKVIIHESPCSSCQERTGWYESEEEWFCQGMYGTFRCSDCHVPLYDDDDDCDDYEEE